MYDLCASGCPAKLAKESMSIILLPCLGSKQNPADTNLIYFYQRKKPPDSHRKAQTKLKQNVKVSIL